MNAPILVVDDNSDMRELMRLFLSTEGFVVHTAADGASALASLKDGLVPGLIFLDMIMKGVGGRDFLADYERDLPETFRRTPVVATSGLDVQNDLKISDYLRKPVELSTLKQAVLRHYLAQP